LGGSYDGGFFLSKPKGRHQTVETEYQLTKRLSNDEMMQLSQKRLLKIEHYFAQFAFFCF